MGLSNWVHGFIYDVEVLVYLQRIRDVETLILAIDIEFIIQDGEVVFCNDDTESKLIFRHLFVIKEIHGEDGRIFK